jgi:hypothetical protein
MSLSTYSTLSSFELLYPEGAPATTMASSAKEVVSPLVPMTASSASSAEVVRPTPVELADSYIKFKSVQTLWAKESVQDDEEAQRPSMLRSVGHSVRRGR